MHDYNTILGVIELRLSKVSYDSVQKRYRIGRSGIALIMNRYKDSGLSLDDLRQMPASMLVDLIYPKENLRHKDIPLKKKKKIHEQMIQMGKHADLSRKRIPLNQNGCTANFRIGVPFEQNLHSQVAANFQLHPSYLGSVFKKAQHTSVLQYISDIRISAAQKLLKEGTMKISEVAETSGYSK